MHNLRTVRYILFLSIFLFVISSCGNRKDITYFQRTPGQRDSVAVTPLYVARIEPGDILSIPITSLSPAASSFFNPYAGANSPDEATTGTTYDASSATRLARDGAPGYLVDQDGLIEMPLLGQIKAAGLSTIELRNVIREKLKKYTKDPTVSVRLLNFKISVLGEVNRPSSYVIPNEQITLPDAIALAGDLTIYGKRNNILVVREEHGIKEFGHVDLTNRDVFSSPYYYLHPNDIVYVEPVKARSAATNQANIYLPVVFSALSLLIVFFQYIK